MKTQSPDTHPEIERMQINAIRQMTAQEKIRRVREMNQFAQRLAYADVRQRHPDAGDQECQLRVASRWLDADLMKKVYGWDVKEKGY